MADPVPTRKRHLDHMSADGGGGFTLLYAEVEGKGAVEIEICVKCHYIKAQCEHRINTWNEAGDELICDLCGIDGT